MGWEGSSFHRPIPCFPLDSEALRRVLGAVRLACRIYIVLLSPASFNSGCCKVDQCRNMVIYLFSYRRIFGWPWSFGNSYCTLLSPNAGEARPSTDSHVLALIATRRRGLLPIPSVLHSLVLDLIVAERFHLVFEYGHTCLVLKLGCVLTYLKKNLDDIIWNGGETCRVGQVSLTQLLVRFGGSVPVELRSAVSRWL